VAWYDALERSDLDALEQSQDGLFRFYLWQSWYQEGADAFSALARRTEVIAGWRAASAEVRARAQRLLANALGRQGVFSSYLGQAEKSRQLLQKSLAMLREHGDPKELAYFLIRSGHLAREAGDYDQAHRMFEESLAISRSVDSQSQVIQSLRMLG